MVTETENNYSANLTPRTQISPNSAELVLSCGGTAQQILIEGFLFSPM